MGQIRSCFREGDDVPQESLTRPMIAETISGRPPPRVDALASKEITIEDFEIIKVLGKGAFGKVLLVRKKDNQILYAMKVLKKEFLDAQNQRHRTKTERSILQRVDSPFLVSLKFAFQTADKLYLVTEFCGGGELFIHLHVAKKFNQSRTKFYAAELILALEALHKGGIIYRDMKPENVLLCEDGHIKLADFGLSKEGVDLQDRAYTVCGTPDYLAPEILLGEGHTYTADWWSLGVLIYEMVEGTLPFKGKTRNDMFDRIVNRRMSLNSGWSLDTRTLITGLLEIDPLERLGVKGASQVKRHPFFEDVNWERFERKEVKAPYRPKLSGKFDLKFFDRNFTKEEAIDTPVISRLDSFQKAQNRYEDFTYGGHSSSNELKNSGLFK